MTSPVQPVEAPVTIYIDSGTASLVTVLPFPQVQQARQDAMILLSATAEGQFKVEAGGEAVQGNAVLVSPGVPFTWESPATRAVCIAVHLTHPRMRTVRAVASRPLTVLDRSALSSLDADFKLAREGALNVEGAARVIDQVLDRVLAGMPSPPPLDPRIQEAMVKLEHNLYYPFERLAAEAGLSHSRLSHLFSATLGVSFRSFVAWSRLMLAWELVALRPELSFTLIAHQMGYSDSAHLARSFHKTLGLTPTLTRNPRLVRVIGSPEPQGSHLPWLSKRPVSPRS